MPPKRQKRGSCSNVVPTVEATSRTRNIASMKLAARQAEEPSDGSPPPAADTDTREDIVAKMDISRWFTDENENDAFSTDFGPLDELLILHNRRLPFP